MNKLILIWTLINLFSNIISNIFKIIHISRVFRIIHNNRVFRIILNQIKLRLINNQFKITLYRINLSGIINKI